MQLQQRDDVNVSGAYTPIVGDFDGDTKADILWFQPSGPDLLVLGN